MSIKKIRAGTGRFPAGYRPVVLGCLDFIECRLAAARCCVREAETRIRADSERCERDIVLHIFLRECWDAVNGLGRLVNCALYDRFAGAGLYNPLDMTRQCTFYNVRRALCRDACAAKHPAVQLIKQRTLTAPDPEYRLLSSMYNISLFAAIPLTSGGEFPSHDDLPEHLRRQVRRAPAQRVGAGEGVKIMLEWCRRFVSDVCSEL